MRTFAGAEIVKYKDAFTLMADRENKAVCVFERNFKTSHLQVQLIPIDREKAKALKTALLNVADKYGVELTILKEDQHVWDVVGEVRLVLS